MTCKQGPAGDKIPAADVPSSLSRSLLAFLRIYASSSSQRQRVRLSAYHKDRGEGASGLDEPARCHIARNAQ